MAQQPGINSRFLEILNGYEALFSRTDFMAEFEEMTQGSLTTKLGIQCNRKSVRDYRHSRLENIDLQ